MRITPSPSPAQGPQQLSRTERLARALIADRNCEAASRADISECVVCGHGMLYRGSRFCSDRCREFYDTGAPGHLEDWRQPRVVYRDSAGREMKRTTSGFLIACAHWRKEFDSKGPRCCSPECERAYRERQDNLAVMTAAGIQPAAKRTCKQCGAVIPKWRAGKKVPSNKRFCSPKCRDRAWRAKA
jgi:predicted nucleic acid-binding Zn ribbon protein